MRWMTGVLLTGCVAPAEWETKPPVPAEEATVAPTPVDEPAATVPATGPASDPSDLQIEFLGVGGYAIRWEGEAVLTPPMYTNPDFFETTLGTIASDPALVAALSAGVVFDDVRAILVGHAHYDHLLDAPTLWPRTADATFYGNRSMGHILAAFAPDYGPECAAEERPDIVIPRDRVVALDAPAAPKVDWRMCPSLDPGTGDPEGEWVEIADSNIRFRALCSSHPDTVGPIHFAPGDLEEDLCAPPDHADDWVEGQTLAFLVDFLDPLTRAPVHRVYYQDTPTSVPTGLVHPDLLAEKAVDVALLNVGSYEVVVDHPAATLALLAPRYTIGGHWEDFFRTQESPPAPLLGHDIAAYGAAAQAALPVGDEPPALVDGVESEKRQWVPAPGTSFRFPATAP